MAIWLRPAASVNDSCSDSVGFLVISFVLMTVPLIVKLPLGATVSLAALAARPRAPWLPAWSVRYPVAVTAPSLRSDRSSDMVAVPPVATVPMPVTLVMPSVRLTVAVAPASPATTTGTALRLPR